MLIRVKPDGTRAITVNDTEMGYMRRAKNLMEAISENTQAAVLHEETSDAANLIGNVIMRLSATSKAEPSKESEELIKSEDYLLDDGVDPDQPPVSPEEPSAAKE